MTDALRLTPADWVMIHGLGLLSRPGITESSRDNLAMIVDIMGKSETSASRHSRMVPLIGLARDFATCHPIRQGYYGALHDRARVEMDRFDSYRMAAAWDALRGGAA